MKLEIQNRLSENLKRLRKERNFTQFELAEKANISEAMVKSVEYGSAWPSEKTLTQIAAALDVDVLKFFIPLNMDNHVDENFYHEIKDIITKNYNIYLRKMMDELEVKS